MRVWVFGAPGSGKTTLARQLAARCEVPHHELDSLYWAPHWVINPQDVFLHAVEAVVRTDRWVVDGNYTAAAPLLAARAGAVVWIDLPFALTYRRVLQRSLSDAWSGRVLFSENRETFRRLLGKDGMPAYAWTRRHRNRARFERFWSDFPGPKARLTSPLAMLDEAVTFCDAVRRRG